MATLRKIITEFTFKGDIKKVEKFSNAVNLIKNKFESLNPVVKDFLKVFGAFKLVDLTKKLTKKLLIGANAFAKLAEDAGETESKFNVVFSNILSQAKEFSDTLVKDYGLARNESKQLLSDTGDLLAGFGFTQEEALTTSNAVQQLAVDLASFTNIQGGSTRASKAITKALIGERESIKLLGIAVLEEDIKREAKLRGLRKELTRQQKAQITLDLILRQSKNAIGDYARTSDSASNRSKLLTKRINDLKIAVGKLILPIRRFIVEVSIRLVNGLIKILPLIKVLVLGLATLGIALLALKAKVIASAAIMAVQWGLMFSPLIIMVAKITAISIAIGLLVDDIIAFFQGRNSVTGIVVDGVNKMLEPLRKLDEILTSIGDKLRQKFPFLKKLNDFNEKRRQKALEFVDEMRGTNFSDLNKSLNLVPTKSINNNSSNINNKAVVQSPNITVNVENKETGGQTLIKNVSKGIQNGLQNLLNQSLRTMTN